MTLSQREDADSRVERLTWKKATRSNTQGSECVELACDEDEVLVRDSKNPRGGTLVFPRLAVVAFVAAHR